MGSRFAVVPLLVLLLAGCAEGPTPAQTTAEPEGAPQLEATATTGVLRGIAVDDAIRPLAGAAVVVEGPTRRETVTDEGGFFGFAGLPAGSYRVAVTKVAYVPAQTTAEVVVGIHDPPLVRLQLAYVPSEAPFVTELLHSGFAQCILPGANLCFIINFYPCLVAQTVGQPCTGNLTSDDSVFHIVESVTDAQRHPTWTQVEMVWDSTQPVTDWLSFRVSPYAWSDGGGIDDRAINTAGKSPVLFTRNQTQAQDWDLGAVFGEGEAKGLALETFSAGNDLTCTGPQRPYINSCSSLGLVLNQKIDFFFHFFYGYAPPEGWRLSVEGSVPEPPR